MFYDLCLQVTKAHAGDYTCTPYNTHGTSGTSGIMQVREKWEIRYNYWLWWLDDNNDNSGSRAGSAQHQAEARGGVREECGGEGDDTDDNSDDYDNDDAGDIPLLRLRHPHPLHQLAAGGGAASA